MTRMNVRRAAYALAALVTLISGISGGLGFVELVSAAGFQMRSFWPFAALPFALGGGLLLLVVGAFLYLIRTPRGWGKLICVVGLPWIGFSTMTWIMSHELRAFPSNPMLLGPGACGAILLFLGMVLLAADKGRFSGPLPE